MIKPLKKLHFDVLRAANIARIPLFKNSKGERAHSSDNGSDWALSAWSNAVASEVGEAANIIKKIERGDFTLDEKRSDLADELADIVVYLDILAMRAGIDLGAAIVSKFNAVSRRVDCGIRIGDTGDWVSKNGESHVSDITEPYVCALCGANGVFREGDMCSVCDH